MPAVAIRQALVICGRLGEPFTDKRGKRQTPVCPRELRHPGDCPWITKGEFDAELRKMW